MRGRGHCLRRSPQPRGRQSAGLTSRRSSSKRKTGEVMSAPEPPPVSDGEEVSVDGAPAAKKMKRQDRREAKRAQAAEGWGKCMFMVKKKGRVSRARVPLSYRVCHVCMLCAVLRLPSSEGQRVLRVPHGVSPSPRGDRPHSRFQGACALPCGPHTHRVRIRCEEARQDMQHDDRREEAAGGEADVRLPLPFVHVPPPTPTTTLCAVALHCTRHQQRISAGRGRGRPCSLVGRRATDHRSRIGGG